MGYQCKIIADSVCNGHRITSFLLTYPRIIHAELMTHRMFSRNSASSRAIPFEKMVKMVEEDPFIPIAWQCDHKGMQGSEYITDPEEIEQCEAEWMNALSHSLEYSNRLNHYCDVTKQLCNRLLEPFMWHTVLLTGTEFENFFELRCPQYEDPEGKLYKSRKEYQTKSDWKGSDKWSDLDWLEVTKSQAEIHMQALAEAMWDAMNESTPKELKAGEWHIPFGDRIRDIPERVWEMCGYNEDNPLFADATSLQLAQIYEEIKIKIAVARCARLSYMTFDGVIDYEKDIKLYNQLFKSKHLSPFEHCARAMTDLEYYSFIKGMVPTQKDEDGIVNYEYYPYSSGKISRDGGFWMGFHGVNPNNGDRFGWCNNFRGFIPYRYLIESSITK